MGALVCSRLSVLPSAPRGRSEEQWSIASWGRSRCLTTAGSGSRSAAQDSRLCSGPSCFVPATPFTLQRLVGELWETPPETAAKTVQVYVSRLRRLLSDGAIESRSGGYALRLDGDLFDLQQFELLAEEGRAALTRADSEQAAVLLRKALALWRGPALDGLAAQALRQEAERFEELRLHVLEDRLDADLGRGQDRDLIPELRTLVAEHPFRERLCAQLMLALYRTGRQTEALEVYRETPYSTRRGARARAERGAAQPRAPDARARPGSRARTKRAAAHGRADRYAGTRGTYPRVDGQPTVVFADVVDSMYPRGVPRPRVGAQDPGALLRDCTGDPRAP